MNKKTVTEGNVVNQKPTSIIKEIEKHAIVLKGTKITSQDELKEHVEALSKLNRFLDALTEEKEKITKPINEALKEVRSRYKPTEVKLEDAIKTIRSRMSIYQTEQLRIQKEEEAKITDRIGEGKGKLKIETAISKISKLEQPVSNVSTESGNIKFRTSQQLKITDVLKIPRMYLIIDEKAVLSALKLGTIIPGAEIEEIQTPINSR